MALSVIYPYRREGYEFELRFSLRGLANVPHGQVIIAGDTSRIVSDKAVQVRNAQDRNRYQASTGNVVAAIEQLGVTGDFLLMNDDFFILRKWKPKLYHRGKMADYLASPALKGVYREALQRTLDICLAHGVDEPLFYGMHAPVVMNAGRLCELVHEFRGERYLLKSLYFNLHPERNTLAKDVKIHKWAGPVDSPVVSSSDRVAKDRAFRIWLASHFPKASPYEIVPTREQRLAWR